MTKEVMEYSVDAELCCFTFKHFFSERVGFKSFI